MSKKYIKVEIKGEGDLPKQWGYYIVKDKDRGINERYFDSGTVNWWLDKVEWVMIEESEQSSQEELRGELIRFAQQFYSDEETCIHNVDNYLKSK